MSSPKAIEISDFSALPAAPLVSVYTLAYRHEKFIAGAIEGVLAQQCDFPIELIIGEDCSPDRTREIVLDYQKRYPSLIRVLTAERNVGAYANSRRCQLAARGQFVAMCEGDDYWQHPGKLQMQVELLQRNPEMVFCHTDFDRRTRFRIRRNRHANAPSPWLAQGDAYVPLLHEWSVMTATAMFRRDIMGAFRGSVYDNPAWPFGDRNRLLFASLHGPVGYINESTATYRKVRGSSVNLTNESHLKMQLAAEECISMFLDRHPVEPAMERNIRARLKQIIYEAAFYAAREDLLQSSYEWLASNGFVRAGMQHRLRLAAISLKIPIRVLRAARNFRDHYLSAVPN